MNPTQWTPFRELDDLLSGYRQMLTRSGNVGDDATVDGAAVTWRPTADIIETDDAFIVKAILPDVKREDISVSIDDGVLKLSGERRYEKNTGDERMHRTESLYGSFFRAFSLPGNVDADAIAATYRDGVLTVRLPKVEMTESTTVRVNVD